MAPQIAHDHADGQSKGLIASCLPTLIFLSNILTDVEFFNILSFFFCQSLIVSWIPSSPHTDNGNNDVQSIRRSVREAALSGLANDSKLLKDRSNDHGSQHYFLPMSTGASLEVDASPIENKRGVFPPPEIQVPRSYRDPPKTDSQLDSYATLSNNSLGIHLDTSLQSLAQTPIVNLKNPLLDINDSLDQVYSPPFLMDSSFFQDTYEDLLGTYFSHWIYVFCYIFNQFSNHLDVGLVCWKWLKCLEFS